MTNVRVATSIALLAALVTASSSTQIVSYVDKLNSWWPPEKIAAGLGIPPYASSSYTVVNLAFWTTQQGPADAAEVWSDPMRFVGKENPWGNTSREVQHAWLNQYHQHGMRVLVSAFGSTDFPVSEGRNPTSTAHKLAAFVLNCSLDGVDIDFEDNDAMNEGKGEAWLIIFTKELRTLLPASEGFVLTHAPQAPYFMGKSRYPGGGYVAVDTQVGAMINWYNIQFYNQLSSEYDTFHNLFVESDGWANGTALGQIASKVDMSKLVLGKPVARGDASNTGYVDPTVLQGFIALGCKTLNWSAGVMGWEFADDTKGMWSGQMSNAFRTANRNIPGSPTFF